jgi:predicted dehydrogenase
MNEVRWGVIGCGNVCERKSGPPLYGVPGSRLIGVTRRNAERGRDFARRHGPCRYYDSIPALLAEPSINAIYIATPPGFHCVHTLAAARAGKHVLVEKPMARETRECDAMIAACRQAGVSLGVAYYRRCYPSIVRVQELLTTGAIGTPRTIRINAEFPLSHRLDLVHFFFGDMVRVFARAAGAGFELHTFNATGVEAILPVGWRETGAPEQVEITGTTGRIEVTDLKGGHLMVRDRPERCAQLPATHWGLIENFVAHVTGQLPLACDVVAGRKSSVILDLVSTLSGREPEVRVDYERPPPYDAAQAARLGLLG